MTTYTIPVESTPGAVEGSLADGVTALNKVVKALNNMLEERIDIFGFDIDLANSDPEGSVTYVGANLGYSPARMNFSSGTFNYGDWADAFFMPKPCMLTFGGVVENYLDPDDYTKNADGSASTVASSTTANAMMQWPVIYVKRWQTGSIYHFRCADSEFDGATCYANINASGAIVPFYTPIYFGSLDGSSRLRSLSGGTNYVNTDTSAERTAAAANGSGWEIERLVDRLLINDLLVLMSKTRDSQTAFGQGVNGASAAIGQGTMNTRGLFWGSSSTTVGVKVFGMENYFGNIWRRLVGWVMVAGVQKVKMTPGTEDGTTVTGFNITGDGYISLANSTPSGTSGGYVSGNKVTEHGLFPVVASGSSSTYSCDGLWFNNADTRLAFVGGSWSNGTPVGASCAALYSTPAYAHTALGAAPSYK